MKKKLKLSALTGLALLVLTACGNSEVTSHSVGLWERLIYIFGQAIQGLSFGGSIGIGIILFTILVRTLLIPLYNRQVSASRDIQELQPKLRELQKEHAGDRQGLAVAQNELYKEHGVNPYASMLPLLIQLPLLMALYQALIRVPKLKEGSFLWVNLGEKDPYYILPLLAAVFTFLSLWLTNKSAKERNGMMTAMMIIMPVFILWFGTQISSGVALYWAVTNLFQVCQTLIFNNPFKIIAERERLEAEEKERQAKIRRAKKKAKKRR
ncbi:membrane protein insertase YidC [Streptococcus dentiloxodontae]